MAGVKVTDLTPTSTADANDVFYIVDTSSNTSKQIEVGDIYTGMPQFESGTFTTVPTAEVNCTVAPQATYYSRVNDVVNCTFFLEVNLDAGQTSGSFELSLPVATNFANVKDLVGIVAHDQDTSQLVSWGLSAKTINNTADITVNSVTAAYGYQYIYITVQYLVL